MKDIVAFTYILNTIMMILLLVRTRKKCKGFRNWREKWWSKCSWCDGWWMWTFLLLNLRCLFLFSSNTTFCFPLIVDDNKSCKSCKGCHSIMQLVIYIYPSSIEHHLSTTFFFLRCSIKSIFPQKNKTRINILVLESHDISFLRIFCCDNEMTVKNDDK